jgi:flagellar export protein FliJ
MAFVFSLKALMRLREIHEKAELQSLQAITGQVNAARAEIESLDASTREFRREMCRDSLDGLSGAELHFHANRESARQAHRKTLDEKLQQLEKTRQAQQTRYVESRQQREILSTLREQQLAAYDLEQSRRAQQEMDELFLMRQIPSLQNPKLL